MKRRTSKSDACKSQGKVEKRPAESSGPTLSKKLRDKANGETSKPGLQH